MSVLLVVSLVSGSCLARAGKLDHTRSVTGNGDSGRHSKDRAAENDDGDDDYDETADSNALLACLIPFVLPFCIAVAALKDKRAGRSRPGPSVGFLSYPYDEDRTGRLVTDIDTRPGPPEPPPAAGPTTAPNGFENEEGLVISETENFYGFPYARAAGRLYTHYYYDLDRVHVPGLTFSLDTSSRLGFQTEWRLYLEPLEATVDKMGMGTMDLTVRLVQAHAVEAHIALGGRLMIAPDVSGGFDSAFSVLMYPVNPLVGELILRIGNLGRALYLEGRASVGLTFRHAALFAGYQGTLLQGKGDGVVFHGPIAGVNLWF